MVGNYMLKLSPAILNVPIYSLRTGQQIGVALRPIINPNNLKIEAWFAQSNFEDGLLVLLAQEIREFARQGIAVNDHDAISPADDLVRLLPLIRLNFQVLGKTVVTQSRKKLGKVEDYAVDLESFYINKLYVSPRVISTFTKKSTVVSRSQITEINDKKIVVIDFEVPEKSFFKAPAQVPEF